MNVSALIFFVSRAVGFGALLLAGLTIASADWLNHEKAKVDVSEDSQSLLSGDVSQTIRLSSPRASDSRGAHRVLAPFKPMSTLHFVKPVRYMANAGETLKVSVTIVASEDLANVTILAQPDSGLVLPLAHRHTYRQVQAGKDFTVSFDVTTLAEGRHYVNVLATGDSVTRKQMSSYSIPVEVGDVRKSGLPDTASPLVEDDQGNRLILMRSGTEKGRPEPR